MPRLLTRGAAFGGTAAALAVALVMPGCVDPQSDYNDWLARTADARAGGSIIDVGATDGGLPDGGFTGTYAMACSTSVNPGAKDATIFTSTMTYTPNASGGGTLIFQNQPLVVGATTLTQTVGNPSNNQPVPITSDGKGTLVYGPVIIPGAANPVTGGDVVFSGDATLHFRVLGADTTCAGLTGTITSPLQVSMDPTKGDVCVFLPVASSSSSFPPVTDDMFTSSPCHAPP
jgi:hypothetical protein